MFDFNFAYIFFFTIFNLFSNNFILFWEFIYLITIIFLLFISIFLDIKKKKKIILNFLIFFNCFIFLSFFFEIFNNFWVNYSIQITNINPWFIQDNYTLIVKTIILFFFFIFLIISYNFIIQNSKIYNELTLFINLSVCCLLFFISANHFSIFACFFIILSILTSTLINGSNYSKFSAEGSIKNYIISGTASALMLISLFYIHIISGISTFSELYFICLELNSWNTIEMPISFILAIGLLLIVFLIKLGAAPFHQGLIDAYDAAPIPITTFLLGILKFGYFSIFIKLWFVLFYCDNLIWSELLNLIGFLSLIFGILPAFSQKKIKRLLNYSTVANIGLILLLFNIFSVSNSLWICLIFMFIYSLTILGIFGCLMHFKLNKKNLYYISDLKNIGLLNPFMAIVFCIFVFSLAGIPPFLGFSSKYLFLYNYTLMFGKVNHIYFILFFSILPIYYYLRLCKSIFMDNALLILKNNKTKLLLYLFYIYLISIFIPGFVSILKFGFILENFLFFDFICFSQQNFYFKFYLW